MWTGLCLQGQAGRFSTGSCHNEFMGCACKHGRRPTHAKDGSATVVARNPRCSISCVNSVFSGEELTAAGAAEYAEAAPKEKDGHGSIPLTSMWILAAAAACFQPCLICRPIAQLCWIASTACIFLIVATAAAGPSRSVW